MNRTAGARACSEPLVIKLSRKVLCLDWDKRTLRIVVARVGGGAVQLEDAHARRIPNHIERDKPEQLGAFIAEVLEKQHIRVKRAIVDVPRDRAFIHRLTLPPTPMNEVAAAVRFQAARELPFPVEAASIDFVVLQRDENNRVTEALLTAVRAEHLEQIKKTCEAAGLTPARIGLRPYANLISVNQLPAMSDQRVLFIDVGPAIAEINVLRGKSLSFSRAANVSVPFFGGELVTDDSRVVSAEELSGLKLSQTVESGAIEELLVEVTRSLQAFRATEPNAPIDQIIVAGSTGVEEALLDALDERFGLPTMLFDPTLPLGVPETDAEKLRGFSAALGLAWGLSREGALEIDFLNPKKPVRAGQTLRRRLQAGGVVAAALLVAGVSWAAYDLLKLRGAVGALREHNSELAKQVRVLRELDVKRLELDDWMRESRMTVWLDHLLELTRQAIEPGKQMLVRDVSCDVKNARVTLKLSASNMHVPTEFVQKLNEYELDGQRLYRADQGAWTLTKTEDERFTGRVDVRVDLLRLLEHFGKEKERGKERDKLIRGA